MESDRQKSPVISALLSGLMPGLGQLYCRRWARGAGFLVAFSAVDFSTDVSKGALGFLLNGALPDNMAMFLLGAVLMLGVAGWSVFDAVRLARP
jgi:hypothetical protein